MSMMTEGLHRRYGSKGHHLATPSEELLPQNLPSSALCSDLACETCNVTLGGLVETVKKEWFPPLLSLPPELR